MTCIVAVREGGDVWMGGDSAGVAGYSLTVRADAKVFRRERRGDPWLFGFTTSFRMGQLIRHRLDLPEGPDPDDDGDDAVDRFLCTTFVDSLRTCLKDGGWLGRDDGRDDGGTFLVGYRGRVFNVADDFQVGEAVLPYDAVGCGDEYALGALHATVHAGLAPEARVRGALAAAEHLSAGVARPFRVLRLGRG